MEERIQAMLHSQPAAASAVTACPLISCTRAQAGTCQALCRSPPPDPTGFPVFLYAGDQGAEEGVARPSSNVAAEQAGSSQEPC